jgi:cytochrome P450 family 6
MFPVIRNCSKVLDNYIDSNFEKGTDVFEFRDLMARFNINLISSVAFGIDNDCINDPDHIFRKVGSKIFESSALNAVRFACWLLQPKLFHKVGLRTTSKEVYDFIYTLVNQTIDYREKNNFSRNDFMQILIQLKNQGFITGDKDSEDAKESAKANKKFTIDEIAAQTFVFFLGGFETSSSTMSFCLYELARNPEIQRKIHKELDEVFQSCSVDEITVEMLSELKYLESCINETLRKYPIVPFNIRQAVVDYKVPESDMIIPKGAAIIVPTLGFHRDPEIFKNPMEFRPERFENSSNGNGNAEGIFFTPFGDGE